MNKLLAIDTSSSACSVAVRNYNQIVDEFILAPQDHIRRLLSMIDRLLVSSGLHVGALDGIIFSAGPGSFTGLRICLGTVQGLAFGSDIPVIPISTMLACAQTGVRTKNIAAQSLVVPCFDARMGEVYWSTFENQQNQTLLRQDSDKVTSMGAVIVRVEQLIETGSFQQVHLIGDGWGLLDDEALSSLNRKHENLTIDAAVYPQARDLLILAEEYLKYNEPVSALEAEPHYVRNEVSWKKREKIRS
ncbi:tRNA (adenosine(37)-N6)-threonylcarbamoyltransferase complex dimerization subunit type 1 TsaB [Aurantivibrio plasticivorans]